MVQRIADIMAGCPAAVCPRAEELECEATDLVPVVLTKPTPQELWLDFEVWFTKLRRTPGEDDYPS